MSSEHPATDALDHLRRAALELVEVARSGLDLVEEIVADPRSLTAVASELGHLARALLSATGPPSAAAPDRPLPPDSPPPPSAGAGPAADGRPPRERPGVQRIPLT